MNNVERIYYESNNAEQFAKGYLVYLSKLLNQIDVSMIVSIINELEEVRKGNNTVFIAGNGGSATTASHMACDIGMSIMRKSKTKKPFRIFSLTDNVSLITAIANDAGYNNMFINQLQIFYNQGDKLIAISASGNSPNIVAAAEWVKARGGKVIGLVGFDGGRLKDICDIVIHVNTPKGEYGPVEDIHLVVDHLIASWLQNKLEGEEIS